MTAATRGARLGATDVRLSPVCLGTMRLDRAENARDLLASAFEIGITALHCSSEYATFPLLCEAWPKARPAAGGIAFIAKIASPHFGEDRFSGEAVRAKVDAYLKALRIERLDVVQWLLRHDLAQEEARLRIMREAAAEIEDTVDGLKRAGKIGAFVSFPYTAAIAETSLRSPAVDGLALYVNPLEHELDASIEEAARRGKAILAIRPYAAGRLFAETDLSAGDALDYALGFAPVVTAVVSASSAAHLEALRPRLEPRG